MKFFDREKEIKRLREIRQKSYSGARFTVITGRRRIGKTTLVLHAVGPEEEIRPGQERDLFLYFFVSRKAEKDLCREYLHEIRDKTDADILGEVSSFSEIFRYVMRISQERPVTLFIDEFQDFLLINPSVFSDMQMIWDLGKDKSKLNLIVGGSINSMMHRLFLDKGMPLYQRETDTIRLRPFSTSVLKEIMAHYRPDYTPDDLLALYSFTGGVAKYVELFVDNDALTLDSMIGNMMHDGSPFIDEGNVMLLGEFQKEYGVYFSILSAIAGGHASRAGIETAVGKEVGGYLTRLEEEYELISKRLPIYQDSRSRNMQYELRDNFLTFWFRFVFKYGYMLEIGAYSKMRELVMRDYATFSGFMLERYFRKKLAETESYTRIGGWWDRKGGNEIDIVASDDLKKRIDFIEVKRNPERYRADLLQEKITAFMAVNKQLASWPRTQSVLSLEDM